MTVHPEIEKVARAICDEIAREDTTEPWDIAAARTAWACALDCLMEPSEAMFLAVSRRPVPENNSYRGIVTADWQAALAAKRKELGL